MPVRDLPLTETVLQEQCYDNLRISKNAWDTNLVKVRKECADLVIRID